MSDEIPAVETPAVEPTSQPSIPDEGKPVGPATIVSDEPMIEQFPAHQEDSGL